MCLGETKGVYGIKQVIYYQKYSDDAKGYANAAYNLYLAYKKFVSAKASLLAYINTKEVEKTKTNDDIKTAEASKKSEEASLKSLNASLAKAKKKEKAAIQSQINTTTQTISSLAKTINTLTEKLKALSDDIKEKKDWRDKTYSGKSLVTWETEFTNYYLDSSTLKPFAKLSSGMRSIINGTSTLTFEKSTRTFTNRKELVEGGFSNDRLKVISDYIKACYTNVEVGISKLTSIKDSLQYVSDAIATEPKGSLTKKEDTWSDKAEVDAIKGTSVSEQNLQEIESVQELINKEDVDELLIHITGALESLESIKAQFDAYTYGDATLMSITDLKKAVDAVEKKGYGEQIKNVSAKEADLKTLSETIWKGMYREPSEGLAHSWTEPTRHPELEHMDHMFYAYLKKMYEKVTKKDSDYAKKKDEANAVKDKMEDDMASYTSVKDEGGGDNSGNKFKFGGALPSNEWKDAIRDQTVKANEAAMAEYEKAEEVNSDGAANTMNIEADVSSGGKLKDMFAGLANALKDMGVILRDDMFISGYIMNMFSYDTFENEKIWEAKGESTDLGASVVAKNTITVNDKSYQTACYKEDGTFECSATDKLKAEDMASLTKVLISPQHNATYGSEVEYIIYADNGKLKPYGTIYAIRAGFNIIYAFSDTELRSTAQGIATALFGVPPLTFLVPIAQAAIIIGVALAESALDIYCLKQGMAIPIYKTKETWMLSVTNLVNGMANGIKAAATEKLKETASTLVDSTTIKINEWLDMTDEQLKEYVSGESAEAKKKVDELGNSIIKSLNKGVEQYAGTAVDQMVNLIQNAKILVAGGQLEEDQLCSHVEEQLKEWAGENNEQGSIMQMAKEEAVNLLISEGYIKTMKDQIDVLEQAATNAVNDAKDKTITNFNKTISTIVDKINDDIINNANGKINKYITESSEKVKNAVGEGSERLKATINNCVDELSGSGGELKVNTNIKAALFSFQYSDYLQLFLMVALLINQEAVLLRTADVIQTNTGLVEFGKVQLSDLSDSSTEVFRMKKAYTYIELDAVIEVKPIFMKLPFMPEEAKDLVNNKNNWYTIQYHGVQGY